jgi:4-amino-4-deoxy-L-arabinose transferase-like glycosyltransferase
MAAPYNWDSHTYHLTRIAEWTQNKTVAHFATANTRQVGSPVLAEYVNAVEYLLLGQNDALVNMLQWFSYLTSAGFVYLITQKLSGGRKTCIFASFLYLAMPIAFAESTTTQADNYATMWLLFFVYIILDFIISEEKLLLDKKTITKVVVMSLCISLGYMSKPSVCAAMLVFLLWLLIRCIKKKESSKVVLSLVILAAIVTIIPNVPEWIRNFQTFGSFSSSEVGAKQIVGTTKPHFIAINFLKNFVWNLYIPGLSGINAFITKAVYALAKVAHNVNVNNPMIAENGIAFAYPEDSVSWYSCDQAHNPVLFWGAIISAICILVNRKKLNKKTWYKFSKCAILAYVLFCVILRWEPFINRYLIAYLTLLCPMVAITIQSLWKNKKRIAKSVALITIILCSINVLFTAEYEMKDHIFKRPEGYFAGNNYENDYISVCSYVQTRNYIEIGLYFGEDSFEYPIWALLKNKGITIHQVSTDNDTTKYEDYLFIPECILVSDKVEYNSDTLICNGTTYAINRNMSSEYIKVFEQQNN